jgi:hypothetical protein
MDVIEYYYSRVNIDIWIIDEELYIEPIIDLDAIAYYEMIFNEFDEIENLINIC